MGGNDVNPNTGILPFSSESGGNAAVQFESAKVAQTVAETIRMTELNGNRIWAEQVRNYHDGMHGKDKLKWGRILTMLKKKENPDSILQFCGLLSITAANFRNLRLVKRKWTETRKKKINAAK